MKKVPNLNTAIEYCREHGIRYTFKTHDHTKFYIDGMPGRIIISHKSDNPDRVKKDIKDFINGRVRV